VIVTTAEEPNEWLSSAEASQLIGVTLRTLYRFIDEGRLPAYRLGRVVRLLRADVERFLSTGSDSNGVT
jgi:excisionase family DNA binding protein